MNPKNPRARRSAVAFSAVGILAAAGITTGASPASAVVGLTETPNTTSVTTLNYGFAAVNGTTSGINLAQALADASFATRITSSVSALKLSLDAYAPPSGQTRAAVEANSGLSTIRLLFAEKTAGSSTGPTASTTVGPWSALTAPASGAAAAETTLTGASGTPTKDVFLTANAPGTYTVHFVDPGPQAGTDDDVTSAPVTMTVLDAEGATTVTTDDFTPTVTNSDSTLGIGAPVSASLSLAPLTLADARGTSSGQGILATKIAALVGLKFTGPAGLSGSETTSTAGTLAGSTVTRSVAVGSTSAAGTLTSTAQFDRNGDGTITDGTLDTETSSVATNGVTAYATTEPLVGVDVLGHVRQRTATATDVNSDTATVTYRATVVAPDPKAGKVVYFTLTPDAVGTVISADGSLVSLNTTTGVRVYSAVTDASGVATLRVTSSKTSAGTYYDVSSATNGITSPPTTRATYAAPAASAVEITSTGAQLAPTVGSSVTLKGRILDQFLAAYLPPSSEPQQAKVTINGVDSFVNLTNGTFEYVYTPTTTPTAGTTTPFTFTYTTAGGTARTVTGAIRWASSAPVVRATLANPTQDATGVNISSDAGPAVTQTAGTYGSTGLISGTVLGAGDAGLAYKTVTLTGSAGVYFSLSSSGTELKTSVDVATDGSGNYTGVYAVYTKPGEATITATSGGQAVTRTVTVAAPTAAFKVSVDDTTGEPGDTIIVTGKVTDIFGNGVAGRKVNLGTDPATTGSLANSDVTTGPTGLWSTSYTIGSNKGGDVQLTATLYNSAGTALLTANPTGTAFKTATGLDLGNGVFRAVGTLAISPPTLDTVTLTGPTTLTAAGNATLTGVAKPGATVDVYAKAVTGGAPFQLVDSVTADATTGEYSVTVSVPSSRSFLVKTSTATSTQLTITVPRVVVTPPAPRPVVRRSTLVFTARALGRGRVLLTVNGAPNARGTATFYIATRAGSIKLAARSTNILGVATLTTRTSVGGHAFRGVFKAPGYATSVVVSKAVRVS